jgi:hypothetical protein
MIYEYFVYAYGVIDDLFAGRFLNSNRIHFWFYSC